MKATDAVYIIAEIGQNHQGDPEIAKELIKRAKDCGVNCVKFQKSCLESKFNYLALQRSYVSPHAWAHTYGQHKAHLEFDEETFRDLQKFAESLELDFTASAMDIPSLHFLHSIKVPFVKIGSGDACNYPLLEAASSLNIPVILSTGMCTMEDVMKAHKILSASNRPFSLMHCISSYPAPLEELNLSVLQTFKSAFPNTRIGYSGHELGTEATVIAVKLGASIVERHFTLNKSWKGSDHACSLTPEEMIKLVTAVRGLRINGNNVETVYGEMYPTVFGDGIKRIMPSEEACFAKLGKTLVAAKNLEAGRILEKDDLCVKVAEPKGIHSRHLHELAGKRLLRNIARDLSLFWTDLSGA